MLITPKFKNLIRTHFLNSKYIYPIVNLISPLGYLMTIKFNMIKIELLIFPPNPLLLQSFISISFQLLTTKTLKLSLMPLFHIHSDNPVSSTFKIQDSDHFLLPPYLQSWSILLLPLTWVIPTASLQVSLASLVTSYSLVSPSYSK